ncbi:MAG: flagellar filament outer layer protein FlaA [Treponema sp.]|nr:flagellar filament outer layer protein FlaA [Treponema sp.]
MKRMLIFVVIVLLMAGPLFAEEAVLIDFSLLTADIHVQITENDQDDRPNQNRQTMMDYSHIAGGSFTYQQKAVMKTSLAIENWEVILSSSSRTVQSMGYSYARESASRQWGTVMGVRVHFPTEPYNAWAMVKPPFEIPAYEPAATIDDDGTINPSEDSDGITSVSRFEAQEEGQPAYGILKNVGAIKAVAVNVYGLNFPHGLSTILIDSNGIQKNVFMGYLNYDGWGELQWNNPAYIQEVRNRDLRIYPLYPFNTPYVKFGGFLIQRDAAKVGGDFVTYFKDVKVIYDKAVLDTDRDIDDESVWRIIFDRETSRKIWEMERFGQNQILRYLEAQKQSQEPIDQFGRAVFTPTPTGEDE